jgi:hypothetical protein
MCAYPTTPNPGQRENQVSLDARSKGGAATLGQLRHPRTPEDVRAGVRATTPLSDVDTRPDRSGGTLGLMPRSRSRPCDQQ